ncbi:hypothetical protein LSTR_LSTR014850, partial [Laodelphax striatellus]
PFPKAGERKKPTGKDTRKRKTAILTDTPVKMKIEEEVARVKQKKSKKETAKGKKQQNRAVGPRKKLKLASSSEDEDDDCFCIVCLDSFKNSKSREKWIQYIECKNWAHELCTPGPNNFHVCHNCDSAIDSN